jgi:oxygen-independent coproporphyrinogen III oxidase
MPAIMIENTQSGLYIHVPFCRSRCSYCDFYSHTDGSLINPWLEALEKEIGIYQTRFPGFDTLYLGGGSPSVLSEEALGRILEGAFSHFAIAPDPEVTLEANPQDLNPEKLKGLRALGINRISLGVQSFDDQELSFLKRGHTGRQALEVLRWIREADFPALSIDLIYGLPGQRREAVLANLEKALSFHPEHLSCYQLTISKGTLLWGLQAKGKIHPVGEGEEEDFFLATSTCLQDQGYIHYEISNFARNERYFSRHNQKYWQRRPYLGLGPSAHSFLGNRRWWNSRSLRRYRQCLGENRSPVEDEEILTEEQILLEQISLGLRTRAGVDCSLLGDSPKLKNILARLVDGQWVTLTGHRLVPTIKGFLIADRLPLFLV